MKINELHIKPIVDGFIYSYDADESEGYYESEAVSLIRFFDECIDNLMNKNAPKRLIDDSH